MEIFPFRALRYDSARVSLPTVVTQPYDKITPAMQDRYYAASPHNLVRIILGKSEPADNGACNVYTRAADSFHQWRTQGILQQDSEPSIYFYSQEFSIPGSRRLTRRGFIALGRIYDYQDQIIFRHEQTLTGPKKDRLELLRSTRAHFGQIFTLYSDPTAEIENLVAPSRPAEISVEDEYGVRHQLWQISERNIIEAVRAAMREKKLIIADGHHRYETALAYRNERRKKAGATSAVPCAPYEKVMMTFINMDSDGLAILPTHRVVRGVDPQRIAGFVSNARKFFEVQEISGDVQFAAALGANVGVSVLASLAHNTFRLTINHHRLAEFLPDVSPRQRQLDVVVLHRLLLEKILGLTEDSIREQRNISYHRDSQEALAEVQQGRAQIAFLLNPVTIAQLRDVAFAGEVMPQKSTDFYPKLLSGLTIYALE